MLRFFLFVKYIQYLFWGFPGGSDGRESACSAGDQVWSLCWEDPLEKEMAKHSSIFAWKVPWTEAPGVLQSIGSQRVGHDWMTNTFTSQSYFQMLLKIIHHYSLFFPLILLSWTYFKHTTNCLGLLTKTFCFYKLWLLKNDGTFSFFLFLFSQWDFHGGVFYIFSKVYTVKILLCVKGLWHYIDFSLSNTFLWVNIYVKWNTEFKIVLKKLHTLLDDNNNKVCVLTVGLTASGIQKDKNILWPCNIYSVASSV